MELLPIVAVTLTTLSILLSVFVLVRLSEVMRSIEGLAEGLRKSRPAADQSRQPDAIAGQLMIMADQLRRVDVALTALQHRVAQTGGKLIVKEPPITADAKTSSSTDDGRVSSRDGPLSAAVVASERSVQEQSFKPIAASPLPATSPPASHSKRDRIDDILADYRKLIAQPMKSEINRWTDELGGESCEAMDEGGFQLLGRESRGLLVLVEVDEQRALVLPSGRLVVDFATDFANSMSMRSVTRQSFELITDGSGVLQVVEPAIAERRESGWQLARAGRLAGLKPD